MENLYKKICKHRNKGSQDDFHDHKRPYNKDIVIATVTKLNRLERLASMNVTGSIRHSPSTAKVNILGLDLWTFTKGRPTLVPIK